MGGESDTKRAVAQGSECGVLEWSAGIEDYDIRQLFKRTE